jgi:putative nucleotidyltransferase with HDIG domain
VTTSRSKPPTNERIAAPRPDRSAADHDTGALPPAPTVDALNGPRADLARAIPRRPRVAWWLGIALAAGFAIVVMPMITAERWLSAIGAGDVAAGQPAPFTIRVAPFAGHDTATGHTGGGGVLIAKGETADRDAAMAAGELRHAQPHGPIPYVAFLLLVGVLAGLFTHHTRRSTQGRLLRVQLVSLGLIVATAIVIKLVMLTTALSVLVVPVAMFAMVPTLVLDRVVGLATGTLAALVVAFLVPFDVGVAVMLVVQACAAGLVIAERPKHRLRAIVVAGGVATLLTAATYPLMLYLSAGELPLAELRDPLHSAWLASTLGAALATALSIVCVPLYELAVGEITRQKLVELEELSHPLLKQIATRAPGTWQHSLTMANLAELAANAIGANGRLVRVGAYFHDLGKSLNPKYFIENLEPGETSPHDKLAPEASCDAIFKHVTEGIVAARKAGLHERIIDFMHMHHGNGVLEYFWARCREQGNSKGLTVDHFRYPGVPPQSRETAILSICDAVEAAARTLKNPDVTAIDRLVQRIVYGKLHVGQLDESGLSMGDLRRLTESLRETIRHANHGRIEYPWQKADQDASAPADREKLTQTGPRLDSLDRPGHPDSVQAPAARAPADALAETDSAGATPKLRQARDSSEDATRTTAPVTRQATVPGDSLPKLLSVSLTGPLPTDNDVTRPAPKIDLDPAPETEPAPRASSEEIVELRFAKPKPSDPQLDGSDARMKRITNPVAERTHGPEVDTFANEAAAALAEAAKVVEIEASEPPLVPRSEDAPGARARAATLPPKPPTVPPPIVRRAPTVQPIAATRPPTEPPMTTVPPPGVLRPPAPPSTPPSNTSPPPNVVRPPGMNYLEDMITLRPQYEPKPSIDEDPAVTQPDMLAIGDATDPNITLPGTGVAKVTGESSWARRLAARLDAQMDEDFGTETPIVAPTRAQLQAMLDAAPEVTRKQPIEEIERLHHEALQARERPSSEDLDFNRRAHRPTSEVDENDIESSIEIAPPARGTAIGVAKKKLED